jgi:hypothetical protein
VTECPALSNASAVADPMYPAPPVTKMFINPPKYAWSFTVLSTSRRLESANDVNAIFPSFLQFFLYVQNYIVLFISHQVRPPQARSSIFNCHTIRLSGE